MRTITAIIFLTLISPLIFIGQQHAHANKKAGNTFISASDEEPETIHIYGINSMKYVVKGNSKIFGTGDTVVASDGKEYLQLETIKVSAGDTVQIKLTTIGDLPASAMAHNWILLKQDADLAAFTKAAMQAKDSDYIPEGHANEIIAHTSLAAGGETVKVTFTAPEKKGNYDFICSFPGHFSAGMKGKLIVE